MVPLLHPCEATTAGHAHGSADGHGHAATADHGVGHVGSTDDGVQDEAPPSCTCIGSCTSAASHEGPSSVLTLTPQAEHRMSPGTISPETAAPVLTHHLDLLPPTTAPPRA